MLLIYFSIDKQLFYNYIFKHYLHPFRKIILEIYFHIYQQLHSIVLKILILQLHYLLCILKYYHQIQKDKIKKQSIHKE